MSTDAKICKQDISFEQLMPLNARNINLKSSRGYNRLLATINAVGRLTFVVGIQPINNAWERARGAAGHLRVERPAFGRPRHHDNFDARIIEAFGEATDIDDELETISGEVQKHLATLIFVGFAAYPGRRTRLVPVQDFR